MFSIDDIVFLIVVFEDKSLMVVSFYTYISVFSLDRIEDYRKSVYIALY